MRITDLPTALAQVSERASSRLSRVSQRRVFSSEVAQKLESKRDPALEEEVITWIKAKTGEDAHPLAEKLNDGLVLCKLVNALKPGIVKAGPAKMPFHKMENVNVRSVAQIN